MIDCNLKIRLLAILLAVIFFVLSYTALAEYKSENWFHRILKGAVWVPLCLSGVVCFVYALTVGTIS